MPTRKQRISITVDEWMWDAVEDYRYQKRLNSKSQAAVRLIEDALRAEGVFPPELNADDEKRVTDK